MSNGAINEHAYLVAYERQKICGDLPETTAFKSYAEKHGRKSQLLIYRLTRGQLSPLDAQRSVRGYPGIVNDIQPCPKRCPLMPLALLGARTDAPRVQLQCEAWPIFAHAHWCAQYAPRVLYGGLLGPLLPLQRLRFWTSDFHSSANFHYKSNSLPALSPDQQGQEESEYICFQNTLL